VRAALVEAFPHVLSEDSFSVGEEKPRSKSFEVVLIKEDGSEDVVWSGIKLGPPRALKFPDKENILDLFRGKLEQQAKSS